MKAKKVNDRIKVFHKLGRKQSLTKWQLTIATFLRDIFPSRQWLSKMEAIEFFQWGDLFWNSRCNASRPEKNEKTANHPRLLKGYRINLADAYLHGFTASTKAE